MNLRRLGFWGVLFCGLLLYVMVFERQPQVAQQAPRDSSVKLVSIPRAEISALHLLGQDTHAVLMRRDRGWEVVTPPDAQVPKENIDSLLAALVDAVAIEVIEENPVDLEQYGLDRPEMTVRVFHERAATPQTLLIGRQSPTGVSLYVLLQEHNRVVLAGTYIRFCLRTFMEPFVQR